MNETEEIKQRLPIEQVVASYLPLKKAGRIYKACCPFHGEKTPSFTVSPERNVFKCFGCNEGGDIFDFVMKIEGLNFNEALHLLAEKAGVTLPERQKSTDKSSNYSNSEDISKDRLYKLNTYVAKLWHTILLKHEKAADAREYLKERGLKEETIIQFEIGYAPPSQVTSQSLQKAGFTNREIHAAGDPTKFQDRIIFPICDLTGRVVAFTGRLLTLKDDPRSESSRGPKYWNTPETPLFSKSRTVYGLHLAKKAIYQEEQTILVEGQMDVVMLHQNGYQNAVASSGTALTSDQLKLMGRFSTQICFAYDQDHAGIEATKRGIELVLENELNPTVLITPHGKDPAECLLTAPENFAKAHKEQKPFMLWLIELELGSHLELNPQIKKKAAKELIPWLKRLKDPLEQAEWLRLTAAHLQTEEENLWQVLNRLPNPNSHTPATASLNQPTVQKETRDPLTQTAEMACALFLSFPETITLLKNQLSDLELVEPTDYLKQSIAVLKNFSQTTDADLTQEKVFQLFPENIRKKITLTTEEVLKAYQEIDLTSRDALTEISLLLQKIRSSKKEATKERLAEEIKRAQLLGDLDKLKQLFSDLKNLI